MEETQVEKLKKNSKKEKPSKLDWIALGFSILALIINLFK